jgi:HEAT repeat protein/squalene-hopene cyclase-like protein
MQAHLTRTRSRSISWVLGLVLLLSLAAALCAAAAPPNGRSRRPNLPPASRFPLPASLPAGTLQLSGPWQKAYALKAGETVEISVHLDRPSALPANGRVGVEWILDRPSALPGNPAGIVAVPQKGLRAVDAEGIYTQPTASWRKVLHALDGDVYLVYRAPVSGSYLLKLAPVVEEPPRPEGTRDGPRWREKGTAPEMFPVPSVTPWPEKTVAPLSVSVSRVDLGAEQEIQKLGAMVEVEPNDTPEQAQPLALVPNDDVRTYEITGTADDVEFFDNGKVGRSGDDWFRVELQGTEPRLVTAQLSIPGQFIAARIRCYKLDDAAPTGKAEGGRMKDEGAPSNPQSAIRNPQPVHPSSFILHPFPLGALLPVSEYFGKVNRDRLPFQENKPVEVAEGRDPNERVHQQEEQHRTSISRILEPGKTYYFRIEANAPGYGLQLRVLRPAPYTDPRMAVRQAMYTQVGQVHAWLANRPRGASMDRRIRDTGNLLGTQCMSCHTQSGVWGPAVPVLNGYRMEQPLSYRQLLNIMYECLRPTNELKDAANNTSLASLDIGDGPAGTRAAGFNIVHAERIVAPRKLHSKQQIRTANYVLQTNDPGGINAAGIGSNVGQIVVWLFAGEILTTAWQKTGDPKYFRALEERARRILRLEPKYTDDVALRLDFFGRVFPLKDYPAQAGKAADAEKAAGGEPKGKPEEAESFLEKIRAQLAQDEARLRAIQNADGTWGFNPGSSPDGGKTWRAGNSDWDPAPTALVLTGLKALGHGPDDPAIQKGVQALLRIQDPNGRWNKAAITGFVTTAYVLHALGRLYPVQPSVPQRAEFVPQKGETTLAAIRRVQALALTGEAKFADLLLQAARHPSTLVRYWAMIGLGMTHTGEGVPVLLAALREKAKPVRDAAAWALKQTLLDDRGWDAVFAAYEKGDDHTREGIMQALGMRADGVMPQSTVGWERLTRTLDRAMNDDPHPAVRAWASKAAWQWWIWNPPVRTAINQAWVRMMERAEPDALVENNNRYSSQALFIANGHKANGSKDHQYKELAALFEALRGRLEKAEPATKSLLARRLVAVAATFYQAAGGDGGPGQMGYVTPGAGALFGQAVVVYLRELDPDAEKRAILAGLEGAANVPHGPLQEYLIDYALKAPEDLRQAAAAAVSDPRSAMLQAATELVEPLIQQVRRGAAEPARRATLSDPVIKLFGSVNWVIPRNEEQQRHFFDLMIPKLDRYASPAEIEATADAARKAELAREMDAAWYLADRLGEVLAQNPDLHTEMVFQKYFPPELKNPLERHFWVRSVPWLLEHRHALPEIGSNAVQPGPAMPTQPDPGLVIKDRALQLYLDALQPGALPQTKAAAVRLSNTPAVRRNPEVLLALSNLIKVEQDERLRKIAENVVKQGSEKFIPDLVSALKEEARPGKWLTPDGQVNPTFLEDFTYFRDQVIPELARVKRSDQASCLGCHGVPGRVPSFTLKPVDEFGYLSVSDLLHNYRQVQARVNLKDVEQSKMLRKPLNVQDGTEDGHQGGRRYLPMDEGYLILKKWVENQPKLLEQVMGALMPDLLPGRRLALGRPPAIRPRMEW